MSPNEEQEKEETSIVPQEENQVIQLVGGAELKIDGLSKEQVQQLMMKYNEGLLDLNKKAQELQIDVGALDVALTTFANNTQRVSEAGDSVTITHSQTSTLGRTEIMMGNTAKAAKGKLSRSQTGEEDRTLLYVGIGAIVLIILALILAT